MNRSLKTLNLGNGMIRHVTRIESDYCEKNTPEFRHYQFEFFSMLANAPDLTQTGPRDFESGKIFFDGQKWIFEFQCDIIPT